MSISAIGLTAILVTGAVQETPNIAYMSLTAEEAKANGVSMFIDDKRNDPWTFEAPIETFSLKMGTKQNKKVCFQTDGTETIKEACVNVPAGQRRLILFNNSGKLHLVELYGNTE